MAMVFAAEGLDGGEKLLLLAYTNYTDPHGYCWPSEHRLADDCGTSVSTVARQKRSLKKRGLLKSVRRINPRTGEPISNLSRINLPLLASMRRRDRTYDDDLVQQISFDDPDQEEASDLLKCHSDTYPLSDRQVPPVNLTGTPGQNDSQSLIDPPQEPVEILLDGRSPATSGSRGSRAGGSAASGKTKSSFSREQRAQYDAFVAALPAPLKALVPRGLPKALVDAVLAATDPSSPAGRTVEQLMEFRLMPKWDRYYSSQEQAGPIAKPVGVLVAMLRRDAECGDARCDERTNVDTGQPCRSCEMRSVDRRADQAKDSSVPVQAEHVGSASPPARVVPSPRPKPEAPAPVVVPAASVPVADYARGAAAARGALLDKAVRPKR